MRQSSVALIANTRGISLIEVLIGLGIVAVVGAATSTLVSQSYKSISSVSSKVDENVLVTDINSIFNDKDLCKAAITSVGTQVIPTSGPLKLQLEVPGYGVLREGQTVQSKMVIREFYMDSFTTPVASGTGGQSKAAGSLWIRTEEVGASDKKSITRKLRSAGVYTLYFNSSTRAIVGCFGASSIPPEEMCQQLGLVWNSATSRCGQTPQQSCQDIGATWNGTKCVVSTISILGKTCSSGLMFSGYSSSGDPICVNPPTGSGSTTVTTTPPSSPPYSPPPPAPTPTPAPTPKVALDLMTWSNGGSINVGLTGGSPGSSVTFERYVNSTKISSGVLGSVSPIGTYDITAPISCHSTPPPCTTTYTVCTGSTCKTVTGNIPK